MVLRSDDHDRSEVSMCVPCGGAYYRCFGHMTVTEFVAKCNANFDNIRDDLRQCHANEDKDSAAGEDKGFKEATVETGHYFEEVVERRFVVLSAKELAAKLGKPRLSAAMRRRLITRTVPMEYPAVGMEEVFLFKYTGQTEFRTLTLKSGFRNSIDRVWLSPEDHLYPRQPERVVLAVARKDRGGDKDPDWSHANVLDLESFVKRGSISDDEALDIPEQILPSNDVSSAAALTGTDIVEQTLPSSAPASLLQHLARYGFNMLTVKEMSKLVTLNAVPYEGRKPTLEKDLAFLLVRYYLKDLSEADAWLCVGRRPNLRPRAPCTTLLKEKNMNILTESGLCEDDARVGL